MNDQITLDKWDLLEILSALKSAAKGRFNSVEDSIMLIIDRHGINDDPSKSLHDTENPDHHLIKLYNQCKTGG